MQGHSTGPEQSGLPHIAMPKGNEAAGSTQVRSLHERQLHRPNQHASPAERSMQLAKALGWFSIGLGLAELLAPRKVSQAIGVSESKPMLLRALGAREIASGIGILALRQRSPFLWSRVAGDVMDLSLLAMAARGALGSSQRNRIGLASAAVAGVALLDMLSSIQHTQIAGADDTYSATGSLHVEKCITVNKSQMECYQFWRNFENFPLFMKHLESVTVTGDNRSTWKAKAPVGTVEWDAEVTVDQPGDLLAWRSLEGSTVDNAGTISFERAPGGRGTIVRVELIYHPPGGKAGALVAKMFGEEPATQIDEDLRRFKQLIETGEIPTTVGQPSGPRSTMTRLLVKKGVPG